MDMRHSAPSAEHARDLARDGIIEVTTLGDSRIRLRLEDPAHARLLKHLPLEGVMKLEDLLFEMFEEEDDESLMLMTATAVDTDALVGLIFWRDINADEMHRMFVENHPAQPAANHSNVGDAGWVKVELLGTDRSYRGHGLGKLLLATALQYETSARGMVHALLQVAGGETNVAANALYTKFGFVAPPSGYFTPKDSRNLRVVWDLDSGLRALAPQQAYPAERLRSRGRWRKVGAATFAKAAFTRRRRAASSHAHASEIVAASRIVLPALAVCTLLLQQFGRKGFRMPSLTLTALLTVSAATAIAVGVRGSFQERRLWAMSVGELRQQMALRGLDIASCVHKGDLVKALSLS